MEQINLLNQIAMYIATKDRYLKYTYCNENVAKGLGLDSPAQIIGKTDYDMFDAKIAKVYQDGDALALKGGIYFNQPEIQPHTDKTIDILVSKNILKDAHNTEVGVICSFVDITDLSITNRCKSFSFDEKLLRFNFSIENQKVYFTRREFSIFKYLMMGYGASLIGLRLNLSHRTIESYISSIKQKLQCSSKQQIIETAMRYGLGHY